MSPLGHKFRTGNRFKSYDARKGTKNDRAPEKRASTHLNVARIGPGHADSPGKERFRIHDVSHPDLISSSRTYRVGEVSKSYLEWSTSDVPQEASGQTAKQQKKDETPRFFNNTKSADTSLMEKLDWRGQIRRARELFHTYDKQRR